MSLAKRLQIFVPKRTVLANTAPDLIQKSQALALKKVREIKELTVPLSTNAKANREIYELADAAALNITIVETFLRRRTK
jgi:hypothetical protein